MKKALELLFLLLTVYPAASHASVKSDLYAYYTRLDYKIPLSKIDMDVPFSNAEHIRAYWKPRVTPAIPSDAPRPKNPILKIGAASPDFGGMFEGNIDHVGIYNRKLGRDNLARLAAGKAVDAALVANYRFNRSMADSAGGKSALAHEGAEFSSDSREGSHSLQLDGRAMWVQLPVETHANQGFTWSAWIKTSGEGTVIAHCNSSGPWHAQGRCLLVRDGNLIFDIGWVGSVKHPADISDGRWHHVAVAAGTKLKEVDLYVDGKCSPGAPPLTGRHADIMVHIDENRRLVFSRETSYCPWLETPAGRFPFKPLVACKPDPMCLSSYVRIIKNETDEVLIHWCHVPDPESIVITEKIHELFAVTPGGMVVRQVKVGTQRLEDFQDPENRTVQMLQLTEAGFKELSLSKPELSGKPSEAVDGRPVRKNISASPAAWLKFDEGLRTRAAAEKQKTKESVGRTVCTISCNKTLWKPGVSGTALAFDGYFSKVTLPGKKSPRLTDELTLEAWVVLGAYPWNDAGIVHQSAGETITPEAYKHGYQDPYIYRPWEMKGYLLGIDPYGRPMFKVNGRQVGSGQVPHKETVSAKHVIPTYRWVHLAGVYGHGRMSLYMNGEIIDQKAASGAIKVPDRDVLVGLNGDAQRISDPVSHGDFAANQNLPIIYGIEGLIDEVKIYDRALSDEQIQQSYRAFLPPVQGVENPCLERRILPGEVTGRPAGKFGATYTTLKYHDLWDNLWRPSAYRDIIVRFDVLPTTVVFWQGSNFGSGWVTANNQWMSDQSCEAGGPHGCAEHMADKRARFGRVRLIENTDARVVVHWRYPCVDVGYEFFSTDQWADEYYTIYPDGVGIRHVARAPSGWHDIQIFTQSGTTCLDNVSLTALTVANLDGESAELTWKLPNHPPDNPIKNACIKVVNFKSDWKVFAVYREGAQIETWGHFEQSKHTPDPFAGPWNHWPVGLNPSDGRYAVSHDRVTHASLGGAEHVGNFIMYGFTDKSATSLIPLAKAWNRPPTLTNPEGCESRGYKQTQRAYILASKASSMSFTLNGSEETPVYNPCFTIENWTSKNKSRLVVNGKELAPGKSFRQGITRDTDGTMTLVVWVELESVSPVRFAIERESDSDGKSPEAGKPLTVASDKLAHPEKTIRRARNNLPRCVDTEDKKLTDLAHSLYEKCLFDKLWEPKLPGLPYRWFSISGANDSSYGKCQLQWDTMFILNAWASLDDDELMRDVFRNYWHVIDNNPEAPRGSYRYGMVPCTIKPQLPQNGYSQIPILGWGCQKVFQQTNDLELLKLCLPYLDAFLNWYSTERDTDGDGLIEYGAYKKCSIADIVQTARFETFDFQATLDNLKLTKHPRRDSGGAWYGTIEGVDQTCFLLMSERAMFELAQETGRLEMAEKYKRKIAKRIAAMQKKMWDPKTNFFYSLDRDSDRKIPVRTLQGFLTLTCGAASCEQAAHLVKQLKDPRQWWPEYPVTTTAMDEPTFDPKGFWRGDMWPPTNYLITLGLNRYGYYDMARELTDKMLQLVEKHDGRSFERYDGTRGVPLGVRDYCWGVTIWNMIVHNVYGVQEDYRTVVVPPHAKGRRIKLGKLELSYPSDKSLQARSEFEREFRVRFPGQSGEVKVHCNGESVKVLQKDVAVPEVVFVALPHKTYMVSMD